MLELADNLLIIILHFYLVQSNYVEGYSKDDIISLVNFSNNAYTQDIIDGYKFTFENEKGLRIKVFRVLDKVIIAFKGTSLNLYGINLGNGAEENKVVDNTMFSCCNSKKCKANHKEIIAQYSYISDSLILIHQLKKLFKDKRLILTGHSLGGALASIVARISGEQAVSFASPGEKYFSDQLSNKSESKILHIGSCNDPIFMGRCGSNTSFCTLLGYRISTKCHSGTVFCVGQPCSKNIDFHRIIKLGQLIKANELVQRIEKDKCNECGTSYVKQSFLTWVFSFFLS